MSIAELLTADRVVLGLDVADQAALLAALARRAAPPSAIDASAIVAALTAREALGSTGLGQGFALPHARLGGIAAPVGVFARLARPIGFAAIDGAPVDLAFLLLTPARANAATLAALAAIARRMRAAGVAARLRAAGTAAELLAILTAAEG